MNSLADVVSVFMILIGFLGSIAILGYVGLWIVFKILRMLQMASAFIMFLRFWKNGHRWDEHKRKWVYKDE